MWEIFHLQDMLFRRDGIRIVIGRKGRFALGYDFSSIYFGAYPVYGHARFFLASSLDGLVYVVPPHALATKLGQERGMKVKHLVWISLDEKIWNEQ